MSELVSVDYSQWERSRQFTQKDGKLPAAMALDTESFAWGAFSVTTGHNSRVGSACSLSKCNHPWNNFRAREAARLAEEKRKARMKEIKVKIRLQEKTLHDIKKRQAELIKSNLDMFHLIEHDEQASLRSADDCLRRYQKSRDGIHVMRQRFERERLELRQELDELKQRLDSSSAKLNSELKAVVDQVNEIYEELALLNNYKDKVYPDRLILIHQLKQQLATTQMDNEIFDQLFATNVLRNEHIQRLRGFGEEESELLEVIQAEHRNLTGLDQQSMNSMKASVAQKALSEVHPSIIGMAHQNEKIKADIEFHGDLNQRLRSDIRALEASVQALRADPEASVPGSMFPQLFRKQDKCQPNMEVVLDIPTRRLPII